MSEIFLEILNRSIASSWIILGVLVLRLLLKKAPKWITVLLWAVVAVRLICPFSIESVLSLIPSAETVSPDIMYQDAPHITSGIPVINATVNPYLGEHFAPTAYYSANPLQILIPSVAWGWLLGVIGMLGYALISWLLLKRKLKTAVLLRDNIYQSENVPSPFVLGIIKPKIYLPFGMGEQEMDHVIAHEEAHIARKDHWWKPLGFFLLSVCWFNPLFWVAYILLCRDIELACDEKVVKALTGEERANYSEALLSCGIGRRRIAACPLAFGEVGVKERVKSVLSYKKPAFWLIIAAVIIGIVFACCFLTDPPTKNRGVTDSYKMTATQRELMEIYPEYFGLDASDGLDVYVYQMTEGSYDCILRPHSQKQQDLIDLMEMMFMPGAPLADMYEILMTYSVDEEKISIIPWQNPLSSYIGDIWMVQDGETEEDREAKRAAYIENIRYRLLEAPYEIQYTIYDEIVADIDGDGKPEECYLTHTAASSFASFGFYAREQGMQRWKYRGFPITEERYQEVAFVQDASGKVYIDALLQGNPDKGTEAEVQRLEIRLNGKEAEFFHNGENISIAIKYEAK